MNTKEKVKDLITDVPELRDNDDRLCCHIWFREIEAMNIVPFKMNVTTFFQLYAKGKLTKRQVSSELEQNYKKKIQHLEVKNII